MIKKDLVRFSISVDWELLKEFDDVIQKEGYENRSFATRALFREFILSAKSKASKDAEGLFVILAVFENRLCDLCEDSYYVNIPISGDRSLCFCVVEGKESKAKEKFRQFNSNPYVEHCKLITMEINRDA